MKLLMRNWNLHRVKKKKIPGKQYGKGTESLSHAEPAQASVLEKTYICISKCL